MTPRPYSTLTPIATAIRAPEPVMDSRGRVWGYSNTARAQGSPASGTFQYSSLHLSLLKTDSEFWAGAGQKLPGPTTPTPSGCSTWHCLPSRRTADLGRANLQLQWNQTNRAESIAAKDRSVGSSCGFPIPHGHALEGEGWLLFTGSFCSQR